MTPDPTLIEQERMLAERLKRWASQFATSNTAMAYDLREAVAALQGSAALPSGQSELMLLENVGKLVHEKLALQRAMQPAVDRLAAWEAGLAKNHPSWNVPDNKRVEIRCGDLRLLRDAMRATTPTAPVQDDDAEWMLTWFGINSPNSKCHPPIRVRIERIASRLSPTPETGLKPGSYFEAMKAANDEIARLKASETGLVEALKRIDEQLWATHGSSNVEALIACLKSVENIVREALSNVLLDEV